MGRRKLTNFSQRSASHASIPGFKVDSVVVLIVILDSQFKMSYHYTCSRILWHYLFLVLSSFFAYTVPLILMFFAPLFYVMIFVL